MDGNKQDPPLPHLRIESEGFMTLRSGQSQAFCIGSVPGIIPSTPAQRCGVTGRTEKFLPEQCVGFRCLRRDR